MKLKQEHEIKTKNGTAAMTTAIPLYPWNQMSIILTHYHYSYIISVCLKIYQSIYTKMILLISGQFFQYFPKYKAMAIYICVYVI